MIIHLMHVIVTWIRNEMSDNVTAMILYLGKCIPGAVQEKAHAPFLVHPPPPIVDPRLRVHSCEPPTL